MNPYEQEIDLPKGHPIHNYLQETALIHQLIDELEKCDIASNYQVFYNLFNKLNNIERRFERKENQLFPFLEKAGWNGPSQNMWSFHDTIRNIFKFVREKVETHDYRGVNENFHHLANNIRRLMLVEESVLFPNSLQMLKEEDWHLMRKGEDEIGWMLDKKPSDYPDYGYVHPSEDFHQRDLSFTKAESQHYDEGYMTIEQVNLLLKTMPLDITYVDENDKVIFYNRGEERTFPRSAGIIGREVKFCHPPKSVHTVLMILEEFRKGTQNEASFWINYKGRLIYIRYFAVRDSGKNYKGVVEMSQDITEIRHIQGEKRLLEWK
ncbi:DUF438 domain-containing protein [Cecembia rubra]|uniref:Hemerythrin-like domain-containing protein n=1 Tax=Cecembia rubra TaxID=1485585 RepID=A0A2P8EE73_9BACT|nr:PAS domain-containing protein [Cecembia rubra]PSL07775.1 hypothetical protein CLV48_101713 [Cecembia rubra]